MSKIQGCEVVRKRELSADFVSGACGTYQWPNEERILLCFAQQRTQTCERLFKLRMERKPSFLVGMDSSFIHTQTQSIPIIEQL